MAANKMLMAAAVVVVIIAVAAALVITTGEDDKNQVVDVTASQYGLVYGNADGDCDLDDTDLRIIQQIIDGESRLADYPLADTNRNGVVDQEDYDLLQKMINRESMVVEVMDVTGHKTSKFPISKAVMTGGTNARVVISVLNLDKYIAASSTNTNLSEVLDKDLVALRESGRIPVLTTNANSDDQTKLAAIDFDAAIIEESGMSGFSAQAFQDLYKAKGASFLEFSYDNYEASIQAIATIGILVGEEEAAQKYIDYCESVIKNIKGKEGGKYGTVTVMGVVMTNSVCGLGGDYHEAMEVAGGKDLADFKTSTKKFPDGSDNTWLLDPKYNPQYLVHYSSVTFGSDPKTSTMSAIQKNFSETAAYKAGNYYVMNGVLPLPVRIAYTAEILYPDCFENGWKESVLKEYMTEFVGAADFDPSSAKVLWSTADIQALLSS